MSKRSKRRKRQQRRSFSKTKKMGVAFQEFHETTMQMPFGIGSLFWAVEHEILTPAEGMTVAFATRYSKWDTGRSNAKSYSQIAKALAISKAYVKTLIKRVADWLKAIKTTVKGKVYKIASHVVPEGTPEDEMPVDEYGQPLKFAIPIKKGGPFERLVAGEISWQACWLWLVMKKSSIWDGNKENAGQTYPLSYKMLKRLSGFSSEHTISRVLKELTKAGMLKRLSKQHETGVYQLYPKPPRTPVKRTPRQNEIENRPEPYSDKTHTYSFNGLYRIAIETGDFQTKRRGRWKPANRDQVPTHIRIDLEEFQTQRLQAQRGIRGGTAHSTPSPAYSNPPSAYSNPDEFLRGLQPSDGLPF